MLCLKPLSGEHWETYGFIKELFLWVLQILANVSRMVSPSCHALTQSPLQTIPALSPAWLLFQPSKDALANSLPPWDFCLFSITVTAATGAVADPWAPSCGSLSQNLLTRSSSSPGYSAADMPGSPSSRYHQESPGQVHLSLNLGLLVWRFSTPLVLFPWMRWLMPVH